jgi:hypothetical protein
MINETNKTSDCFIKILYIYYYVLIINVIPFNLNRKSEDDLVSTLVYRCCCCLKVNVKLIIYFIIFYSSNRFLNVPTTTKSVLLCKQN